MSQPKAGLQAPSDKPFSYDEVPYESFSYTNTHPDHLYMVGKLFNMNPPDFRKCRVLELGCAAGGNLFPLAWDFPESHFTGIDLSSEEIEEANRFKKLTKLKNIDFMQKNIMEIGESFGAFDYIIAHGVFSWVPAAVREKILDLCEKNMSPDGLAMISYNAYPGWHLVGAARNIMKYHAGFFETPAEKVAQARILLNFLSQNMGPGLAYMKEIIDQERTLISGVNDTYVYHDHLSGENNPFYLHEFASMLEPHNLQYVGDCGLSAMYIKNLGPVVAQQFAKLQDAVRQEQYMDFLLNRRFRMSIVARKGAAVNRKVDPERIFDFWLTPNIAPESENPDIRKPVVFKKKEGKGGFTSNEPAVSAFFLALTRAEVPVRAEDLVKAVQKELDIKDPEEARRVPRAMGMEFAFADFINLYAAEPGFIGEVSAKPRAHGLARVEAMDNPLRRSVTNAARLSIGTGHFSNLMIAAADGKNTAGAIADKMVAHVKSGDVKVQGEFAGEKKIREIVENTLQKFAKAGLLVE